MASKQLQNDHGHKIDTKRCREILGEQSMSEEEAQEFLIGLHAYLNRFLDSYFADVDDELSSV